MGFRRFLDNLDSSGGHICVLFALLLAGLGAYFLNYSKAESIIEAALGALLYSMKIVKEK